MDIFFLSLDIVVGLLVAYVAIYVVYRLLHEDR